MGQTNFGPAGFVGVGAYGSALLMMKLGLSFWLALPLAGLVAAIVGTLIGYPTLRLRGLYFAITTFAFQEVLRTVWLRFREPFGGPTGIYNIPLPDPISLGRVKITFDSLPSFYYLTVISLCITVLFFIRVDRTRFGMTLRAIREADDLAQSAGVNLMRYQVLGWTISCFFTGIAGGLYAHYIRFIDPYTFSMFLTVDIIAFAIVGGIEFAWSPILGAFILVFLGEMLRARGGHYSAFFTSIALVGFVIFFRGGITRLLKRLIEPIEVKFRWTIRNKD
jgi:branched-chain amino acid transport system permease protein